MTRHYYITGIDGIGKTTQVDLLQQQLVGQRTHRVWLRFPMICSLPLLIYARLTGLTRYETFDGVRVGAWEFYRSPILRTLFPFTQYLDTFIISVAKVWIPLLLGKTLLFERFALDVLVDVMVATRRDTLHTSLLGRLYIRLIPQRTLVVIMKAPVETVRQRRADLHSDPLIEQRAATFEDITHHFGYAAVQADQPIHEVAASIHRAVVPA